EFVIGDTDTELFLADVVDNDIELFFLVVDANDDIESVVVDGFSDLLSLDGFED
ncbi:unnamed protein product, partial [Rotaria sp. Silwood1]